MKISGISAELVEVEGVSFSTPSLVECDSSESEDDTLHDMTTEVARSIVDRLKGLLEADDLNIQDVKDIATMNKEISIFLKNMGTKPSSGSGLQSFISRLKA